TFPFALHSTDLDQLPRVVRSRTGPVADLAAAAGDAGGEAAGQYVPAEEAMVRGGGGQGARVAGQDFVADRGEAFAEHLADIRMPACPADDLRHAVAVNVANAQLLQVRGEAAARLHLPFRIDDQGLPRPFAIVFDEPLAVPAAAEPLGPFDGGKMIPVQRGRQLK